MCCGWNDAYRMYSWMVDPGNFSNAANYPGYFDCIINADNVVEFENTFRKAINEAKEDGRFTIAGEVCFWKNYGNAQARNRVTQALLDHLSSPDNRKESTRRIQEISNNPSYNNFVALRDVCNQPRGFATPITFLAFYKPTKYPMVDKHIANWWKVHKADYGFGDSPNFSQRYDGWIQTYATSQSKLNWDAYISWRRFCNDYVVRMAKNCRLDWRATDVEITSLGSPKEKYTSECIAMNSKNFLKHRNIIRQRIKGGTKISPNRFDNLFYPQNEIRRSTNFVYPSKFNKKRISYIIELCEIFRLLFIGT